MTLCFQNQGDLMQREVLKNLKKAVETTGKPGVNTFKVHRKLAPLSIITVLYNCYSVKQS
jgi:hypothetical protein